MLTQEKYDIIITVIEQTVNRRSMKYWEEPIDSYELGEEAFKEAGCDYIDARGRNEIFKFITGITLVQYVNIRIMMRVYKELLKQNTYDCEPLINISGMSSEAALYKKFKAEFGMSMREAFERKIALLYENPIYWDNLSLECQEWFHKTVIVEKTVTVEKIKWNRRAYIILPTTIVLIAAILTVVIYEILLYERWNNEYIISAISKIYASYLLPSGGVIEYCPDGYSVKFDLKNRSGYHEEINIKNDIIIKNVKWNTLTYEVPDWDRTFTVYHQTDGTKLIPYNWKSEVQELLYYHLLKADEYEEVKQRWEGTYEMSKIDDIEPSMYVIVAPKITINIVSGVMSICTDDCELALGGSIIYKSADELIVRTNDDELFSITSSGDNTISFSRNGTDYNAHKISQLK